LPGEHVVVGVAAEEVLGGAADEALDVGLDGVALARDEPVVGLAVEVEGETLGGLEVAGGVLPWPAVEGVDIQLVGGRRCPPLDQVVVPLVANERVGALVADEVILRRSAVQDVVARPTLDARLVRPYPAPHARVVRGDVVPVSEVHRHDRDTEAADGVGVLGGAATTRGDGVAAVVDEELGTGRCDGDVVGPAGRGGEDQVSHRS
jgi:hypothetical protein